MPGMASARCCHGVLCSCLNTATAPNAMIAIATTPAAENIAIGPQFRPWRTRIGAVGLRPLPPPAFAGGRPPGRPAGWRTPLVGDPPVRPAVLAGEADLAGAADAAGLADLAGVDLEGVDF